MIIKNTKVMGGVLFSGSCSRSFHFSYHQKLKFLCCIYQNKSKLLIIGLSTSVSGQQSAWSLPPESEKRMWTGKWSTLKLNAQYWFLVVNASAMKKKKKKTNLKRKKISPSRKNGRERREKEKEREKKKKSSEKLRQGQDI